MFKLNGINFTNGDICCFDLYIFIKIVIKKKKKSRFNYSYCINGLTEMDHLRVATLLLQLKFYLHGLSNLINRLEN
jgi:hypothetical protein